ncbi:MAG: lysostaphin resistance A-like protein [Candidatus Methylacidiphilales bacterium]
MDPTLENAPWAAAFAGLLMLASFVRGLIWILHLWKTQRDPNKQEIREAAIWSTFDTERNSEGRFQWMDLLWLLLACVGAAVIHPLVMPFAGIGFGVWLLSRRGIPVSTLWGWRWDELPTYLGRGLDRYLLILFPVSMVLGATLFLSKQMGWEAGAQPLVLEFLAIEDTWKVAGLVFAAVVVAPVWEELFFRGILYPMMRGLRDRVFALLTTSILFGLVHAHGPSLIALALFGGALAWIYERTGKIGCAMALHAAFNTGTAVTLLLIKYAPAH